MIRLLLKDVGRAVDLLFTISHPSQEFLTYMEMSGLPLKSCKI
jgi:hypothetical protein